MKYTDKQKCPSEIHHLPTTLSPYSEVQSTLGSLGGRESFGGLQSTCGSLGGRGSLREGGGFTCSNEHDFIPHLSDTALHPNATFNPSQQTNNPFHTALTRDATFHPSQQTINLDLASYQNNQRGHQYSTPAARQQYRPHTRYVTKITTQHKCTKELTTYPSCLILDLSQLPEFCTTTSWCRLRTRERGADHVSFDKCLSVDISTQCMKDRPPPLNLVPRLMFPATRVLYQDIIMQVTVP